MKKFIVLSLAGILIFALGATVYAQAPKLEFRASGMIDFQTFYGSNVPQYNSGLGITYPFSLYNAVNPNYTLGAGLGYGKGSKGINRTQSGWEGRAHLKFDAIMGPNLSGTIMFEIDTFRQGATWAPTMGNGREANNYGGWTTDRMAVEVKNIYIDVGLPYFGIPVPMTARIGAQTLAVRGNMFLANDGFGIIGGIKADPFMIIPIYAKPLEGLDFAADDCDVYGLHVNAKVGTFTVGGYGLLYNMQTYPFLVLSPITPINLSPTVQGTYQSHMSWVGLYADGKAGPVNLNWDLIFSYGTVNSSHVTYAPQVDYFGWATRAKIDFPWEKFNFGVVGMYATGSDAQSTSSSGLPGSTTYKNTLSHRVNGFVLPPGTEQGPANGESMVIYSMEPGATGGYGVANMASYNQLHRGAFGGTWFAKLYGSAKLTPWYKVTLNALYIGDTTTHGDTFGTSVRPGSSWLKDHKDIGWEFDIINEIWIYQNLRFFIGFGYLIAGGAMDVRQGTTGFNVTPANPWALRTRLQYTF